MQLKFWINDDTFPPKRSILLLLLVLYFVNSSLGQIGTQSACYDEKGIAKTCLTYPKNVALNRIVTATDTCGTPSEVSCQIGANTDRCRTCDAEVPQSSHPARNIIDFHNPINITWWQSTTWWQTNSQGLSTLQNPPKVNVTLSFNKLYLVSGGIRVTFYTVRPKKMAIQRSNDYGNTWSTYQYYAKNCQNFYGLPADPEITKANKFTAICTQKFSSELPYIGGVVVFDPRLTRYENAEYQNPDVQNYLSATNIQLLLEYPGTDGRENINSSATLNQYYYAISDVVVDARCHCYGHAEYCDFRNGTEVCDCQHFTTGKDCEICLPLYNNRAWMPGNKTDANECQKCECNDHASACIFNQTLGFGVCQDCRHYTTGYNCETCIDKFYRNISKPLNHINVCIPCDCFSSGILDNGSCLQTAGPSQQHGQCNCKAGVYGRRCDQCVPGKWGFSTPPVGTCFDCICNIFGTVGSNETCEPYTGQCQCKINIQEKSCSECKDTFHSFPTNITGDCQPCGCHIAGGYPVCNKKTGDCSCRRGISGRQCSFVTQGFFFPNFTHANSEIEMIPHERKNYFWVLKGYKSIYTGIGQIKLNPGQSVSFIFQVPVTYRYFMLLRYSLFPLAWLNTLFLYDAETLTWSGSDLVSTYTKSSDRPSSWNVTITLSDAANSQFASSQLSVASLNVGEAKIWNDSSIIQLSQGLNYKLTMTYEAVANSGNPWPIMIDSVVFLPDFTQNSYFISKSEGTKNEILDCRTMSASLTTTFQLPTVCRELIFGTSTVMYNGSLACDCFTPGSNNATNCESYGGQCYCKHGYGGRRCNYCLAGFHGNPSTGCIACQCSTMGSLTSVCNQTNGQCFCKTNTQGSNCGQCKPSTFSMSTSNPDGCQSCYGFGHSVSCRAAQNFSKNVTFSNFMLGRDDGWYLINELDTIVNSGLSYTSNGLQYIDEGNQTRLLSSPPKYLGNQLNSYGQRFFVQIQVTSIANTLRPRDWQVRLVGGGMIAVFSLFPRLSTGNSSYFFYLHEKFMANDTKLSEFDFKSLLGQLSAIHLSLNLFESGSVVTISHIEMTSASITSSTTGPFVSHVENATCQTGYEGLSCERCAQGYTRAIPNGGPLVNCVPCSCNDRSTDCHPQTGICTNCRTATTGDHCETCMPNLMLPNCTTCIPGFWKIAPSGCEPCSCYLPGTINGNSESCDLITGQCLCNSSMHVAGRQCNQCKQNAYNISLGELQCKQCPPCYSPIEEGYIEIRYQNGLLQQEVSSIWNNQAIIPRSPLDQSVAALSVTINSLTSQARASIPNVTSLDLLWSSLQTETNILQSALATSTHTVVNNYLLTVTQLLSIYNQSFASIVAISTNVVSSQNQLTTSVANIIMQQEIAVKQLSILRNNSLNYIATTQSLLTQANSIKSTALSRVLQSIQTASIARNNSQTYQTIVNSLNSSMTSVRNAAVDVQRQGNEVNALAAEMRTNASAVSIYATQLQRNITETIPDHSQAIASVSTTTTSLRNQITSLNELITVATRDINGIEQQISVLKQANTIHNSQISTTERRLDAAKTAVSSASLTSSTAISSAINTEKEAVSMLDMTSNFKSVSQTAANDASIALSKIDIVLPSVYRTGNITANISGQIIPLQANVTQVGQLSTQAHQIAITETQNVDILHNKAVNLRNDANSGLDVIRTLNIQQYINNSVSPLLSKCEKYTSDSKVLAENSTSAQAQSLLSYSSAQTISLSIVKIGISVSNIPSIDRSQLTPIFDNLLRVRQAYSVLGISGDLAYLRSGIERMKLVASSYRTKINSLKTTINAYNKMYISFSSLDCNTPSQIP